MPRQFGAYGVRIRFRNLRDRFRDTAVIKLPPGRAQLGVCNLAQFVVGKVVRLASLQPDNPALPKLIEQRNQSVFIGMTGSRQEFDRKRCTHASG